MPHIRMIPSGWHARCALTGILTAVAVLCGMLPAGARDGLFWITLPSMPTARSQLASAAAPCPRGQTGSCLYAVGGTTGGSTLATAESYNRRTNAWSTLPPLPAPRSALAAAAAPCPDGLGGTCVYALGGSGVSGAVTFYNPAVNAWGTATPLKTARRSFAAASAPCPAGQGGMCVYAVGGVGSSGALATVESFNPVTRSWSTVASLRAARYSLGAAAAPCPAGQTGICVYAVGGFDGNKHATGTVESYNPATRAWSQVASLPVPRGALGVAASSCPPGQQGTCVYAVGGATDTALLADAESFNPASNAWTTLPSQPGPRSNTGAAALPCPAGVTGNCVYVVGGVTNAGEVARLEALDPPSATRR
ncbi:Kelch repeat-containing protein [Streptomyces sp. NPDC049687]|uniref:Kelch repeat-containing protein n=1 Tax=Streptomyces sp. NPDC049687 TaxID=3365596 RepID=UPI003794E29C